MTFDPNAPLPLPGVHQNLPKEKGLLDKLWTFESLERLADRIGLWPAGENSATVLIQGQPTSVMNDLYQLALGICTGLVPILHNHSTYAIHATFDHTEKAVSVMIAYTLEGTAFESISISEGSSGLSLIQMMTRPVQGVPLPPLGGNIPSINPGEIKVGNFPVILTALGISGGAAGPAIGFTGNPPNIGSVALSDTAADNPRLTNSYDISGQGYGTYGYPAATINLPGSIPSAPLSGSTTALPSVLKQAGVPPEVPPSESSTAITGDIRYKLNALLENIFGV